ncbi:MAG TPA: CBS domain-containing protein [Pyrinomonadaceae bacterium]|nr:CBS domain-containing protein [Pyrinomonadaceae bacterium]
MSRYRDDLDDDFYRSRRREDEGHRGQNEGWPAFKRRGGEGGFPGFERREHEPESGGGRRDFDEDERAGYTVDSRYGRRDYEEDDRRGREYSERGEGREYYRREGGGPGRRRGPTRSHVRCRDIMTRDVTVATRDTTLEAIARMMRDEDAGVIPVVDRPEARVEDLAEARPDTNRTHPNVVGNGRLVGLITDRDIVVRAVAEGKDARATRAEEIMTTDIHTAQPNARVIDAIRKMGDKQVRRIPIVDREGQLRGIISMADVALETEEDRELAEALEEISSGASFWNRVFG